MAATDDRSTIIGCRPVHDHGQEIDGKDVPGECASAVLLPTKNGGVHGVNGVN